MSNAFRPIKHKEFMNDNHYDIKIYTRITSLNSSCDWVIAFSISKCKHLKYGTIISPYEYNMNDEGSYSKLEVVLSEKDVGVWMTILHYITLW